MEVGQKQEKLKKVAYACNSYNVKNFKKDKRKLFHCKSCLENVSRKKSIKGSDQRENRGVWSNINTRYLV